MTITNATPAHACAYARATAAFSNRARGRPPTSRPNGVPSHTSSPRPERFRQHIHVAACDCIHRDSSSHETIASAHGRGHVFNLLLDSRAAGRLHHTARRWAAARHERVTRRCRHAPRACALRTCTHACTTRSLASSEKSIRMRALRIARRCASGRVGLLQAG